MCLFLCLLGDRHHGEGQASSMAGAGHAQSVPAAGGAGGLHNDPNREPERDWLCIWSYCKLFFKKKSYLILFSETSG